MGPGSSAMPHKRNPVAQVESALDPAGYLGAAGEFTDAALAAHGAATG